MGLSGFLDVAIGLIFMYLVLSLICTTVNELIATQFQWRAKSLQETLTRMLDNEDLRKAFYNSGLISNTTMASRGGKPGPGVTSADSGAPVKGSETDAAGKPKDTDHPSYLDGRTFAMALLDSLTVTAEGQKVLQTKAAEGGLNAADATAAAALPKEFPTFKDIQDIVGKLPDSNIRDVLLANLSAGPASLVELRNNVAAWFDSAMDRLSGSYKRWLKVLSLIVGIVVALLFNADSFSVGKALWSDEALRGQIVNAAAQYVNKPPEFAECKETDPAKSDPAKQTVCNLNVLKQQQALLRPFPIGWPGEPLIAQYSDPKVSFWLFVGLLLLKVVGCVWTGLALSLGAPFWFDTLQKFMNVRGAGTKPDDEKTKQKNENAVQVV